MAEGIVATSYKAGDKFFIDPAKLLPMERFLPQPKGAAGAGRGPGGRGAQHKQQEQQQKQQRWRQQRQQHKQGVMHAGWCWESVA